MKKALFPILALVLALGLALPMATPVSAADSTTINYGDLLLSSPWQTWHGEDIWDLTQGDLTLSYTINMTGLKQPGTWNTFLSWQTSYTEVGLRGEGAEDFNPGPWDTYQGNCGGWMTADCDTWNDGDGFTERGAPKNSTQDLDDKFNLAASGGRGECDYDVLSSNSDEVIDPPIGSFNNHGIWFDRDGVDTYQDDDPSTPSPGGSGVPWSAHNGQTYNTTGIYDVVITYHAIDADKDGDKTDDGLGVMFATVNGIPTGFYDTVWHPGEPDYYPAGLSFKGDMEHMQVFAGIWSPSDPAGHDYGDIQLSDITVTGYPGTSDPLVAGFSYTFTSDVLSPGDTVQFTDASHGGMPPYTYLWKFGDDATSAEQNPTHVYTAAGNYTVKLEVTPFRCVPKTIQKTIEVVDTYEFCGFKYADWEGERIPLPDWQIILEKWDGDSFERYATTTTDESGRYCFTDLPAGTYQVSETIKDGWDQVYPTGGHEITLPVDNVVYGTQRTTGNIWQVDPTTGDATLAFTAPIPPFRSGSPGSPNGLAYDTENSRWYYTEYTGGGDATAELFFHDGVSQTFAGNLTGAIACADFYDGKYYYIAGNPTDDLYEVTFNLDGTVATNTKLADISGNVHRWTFGGDIAVSPDGVIYGLGACGVGGHGYEFFKVNRDGSDFEIIKQGGYAFSLQLAFGSDGTLYGHESTGDGLFYAVDLATGDLSAAFPNSINYLYTDLASCQSLYNFVNTPHLYCFDETAWAAAGGPAATRFVPAPGDWATYIDYTVGAGNETNPVVFPLYAGQTYYAGDLLVWNVGNTLYVKYVASGEAGDYAPDGYCGGTWTALTEYHLQVVDEFDGFQAYRVYNRKTKEYTAPIPGQFDNIWEGDRVAETPTIEVDISGLWNAENTDLYIAAHAVMLWCGYDCDVLQEIADVIPNGD